jgi:hypothetical protein
MSRYPLNCDNILSAEVVLADGRVVTTLSSEHPISSGRSEPAVMSASCPSSRSLSIPSGMCWRATSNIIARSVNTAPDTRDLAAAALDEMTLIAALTQAEAGFTLSAQFCHAGPKLCLRDRLQPATSHGPDLAAACGNGTADGLAGFGQGAYVNVMGCEGSESVRRAYDATDVRLARLNESSIPRTCFRLTKISSQLGRRSVIRTSVGACSNQFETIR